MEIKIGSRWVWEIQLKNIYKLDHRCIFTKVINVIKDEHNEIAEIEEQCEGCFKMNYWDNVEYFLNGVRLLDK